MVSRSDSEAGAVTGGRGVVLGVLGAPGGVGASTLATACAVRAVAAGRGAVLVDARPWGGGLEVAAGVDLVPGLRWADLLGVRGQVEPQRLLTELPSTPAGLRVLSWDRPAPDEEPVGPDPVLTALRGATDLIVVDLPGPGVPAQWHQEWWSACDEVVLVVRACVTGAGASLVTARVLPRLTGLVLRTPAPLSEGDVSEALGAPVLVGLREDRAVAACLERGRAVGSEAGPLTDAADEVLACLLPGLRAA